MAIRPKPDPSGNTTAAIYIRKSHEDRDKPSHRLTVQREQLPAHARAQGWAVQVYDDGHASAARGKPENLKERTFLERDICAGKIGVVLCTELPYLSLDNSVRAKDSTPQISNSSRIKTSASGKTALTRATASPSSGPAP